MTYAPTVILVDDHDMVRAGVAAQLGDRVQVLAEAGDVGEAINKILDRSPEVVLLDVHLPSGTGADVITGVRSGGGDDVRFLALSVSDAPDDVIAVIRAGRAGMSPSPSAATTSLPPS